jgi:RND family efflux transporter MFP subunit
VLRLLHRFCCVLALLPLLAGCKSGSAAKPEGRAAPSASGRAGEPREVKLVKVTERELDQTVRISGTLAADEQVTVSVKVPGRLATLSVDVGTAVKKDQTIAQVETTDYRLRVEQAEAALGQARAQLGLPIQDDDTKLDVEATATVREAHATLDEAKANLDRTRSLSNEGLATGAQLDAAQAAAVRAETGLQSAREQVRQREAAMRQRRSEVRLARQQLADTALKSPIDGVVQTRQTSAGEYLAAGAPVAQIVRIDPLRLRVSVPERDAAGLRANQAVHLRIDGDPKTYAGIVARLAPAIDQQSRSLRVESDIKNPGNLRPGSFVNAEIVVGNKAVPTVPASSIIRFAGLEKVIIIDNGKAVEKTVTTGKKQGDFVELKSGIKAGELVVERPGSLQQGHAVKVIEGQER